METYIVIIDYIDTPSGKLYGAFVPDVPGCTAMGISCESVISEMSILLRKVLLREWQLQGGLPKATSLADLASEYARIGEELLSSQSMVAMFEVSPGMSCIPRFSMMQPQAVAA